MLTGGVDAFRFTGRIRWWNEEKGAGLAVADVPAEHIQGLGGLRQQHVEGSINGADFASNVMPAGGGRLALSVSKAMLGAGRAVVGDEADFEIRSVGRR